MPNRWISFCSVFVAQLATAQFVLTTLWRIRMRPFDCGKKCLVDGFDYAQSQAQCCHSQPDSIRIGWCLIDIVKAIGTLVVQCNGSFISQTRTSLICDYETASGRRGCLECQLEPLHRLKYCSLSFWCLRFTLKGLPHKPDWTLEQKFCVSAHFTLKGFKLCPSFQASRLLTLRLLVVRQPKKNFCEMIYLVRYDKRATLP